MDLNEAAFEELDMLLQEIKPENLLIDTTATVPYRDVDFIETLLEEIKKEDAHEFTSINTNDKRDITVGTQTNITMGTQTNITVGTQTEIELKLDCAFCIIAPHKRGGKGKAVVFAHCKHCTGDLPTCTWHCISRPKCPICGSKSRIVQFKPLE